MCGIAGFVHFDGHRMEDAAARLRRMTDRLAHRGPDGEGWFVDGHAALGHRRLAIIDVTTGQQPMGALNGRVQIVFNGEIYNYLDVRAELEGRGHRFHSRSDTEVILRSYLEWGRQSIQRLDGMFAFAIWDARMRELWLVRDRTGEKPLYYSKFGGSVGFASEIKALHAGNLCGRGVDPEALDCYMSFGYVPAPKTIYRDVRKLRAAHWMRVTETTMEEKGYWRLSFADPVERSLGEASEELEPLIDQAVKSCLMSEVPLGAFLSGGIDSSLIVSSMARNLDRPVISHSIGFGTREEGELPIARRIATYLGTDHHEFVVTPKAAEVIDRIAWHFDEPIGDPSALPTWYLCEAARRSVTVVLSGDGGDEAFGGYTFRYTPHVLEAKLRGILPAALRGPLFGAAGAAWPGSARLPKPLRLKTIFENLAVGDAEAFYRDLIWLRTGHRQGLYSREFLDSLNGFTPAETLIPHYLHNDAPDALGRGQATDLNFYMTDDVLAKVDRMSMAHSLEVRAPFLDRRILEYAARLPRHLKMHWGRGKIVLREIAGRRLPSDIQRLPKRGFSIPTARWLRGELKPIVEPILFARDGLLGQVVNPDTVKKFWSEHQHGARDHHVTLWSLMMLGLWDRYYGTGDHAAD